MEFIKASDRMPEPTNGFAKQIVLRFQFKGEHSQLRISTINEFIGYAKFTMDLDKVEWLDGDY